MREVLLTVPRGLFVCVFVTRVGTSNEPRMTVVLAAVPWV